MFTSNDLKVIYNPYFTVLKISDEECEVQSNNTLHCWFIKPSTDGYQILFHKHRPERKYHYHSAAPSVQDCLLEIVNHDEYQLRGRKPERYHGKDTFFDFILKVYGGM